jgi:hypothetical protein
MRKIEREYRKILPPGAQLIATPGHIRIILPNGKKLTAAGTPGSLDVAVKCLVQNIKRYMPKAA